MEPIRIGINGFGRVGRCVFKQLLRDDRFTIAGINDLAPLDDLAYLLKYDSIHGWYPAKVSHSAHQLHVDETRIPFCAEADPGRLPWTDLNVDVVLECSGAHRKGGAAARHLEAGARRVIISAPSDDAEGTFVPGVNADAYDPARHRVVSLASCTTNSLAPVAKVLHDRFGVEHLLITTVHAYTSSQSLMDLPARKRRRGRAAAVSIIPTTTGATRATALVLPELGGRMDGLALRVPVPNGSVTDIVATLQADVTAEAVNGALRQAALEPPLEGVLRVTEEAIVSVDVIGDPHSAIVDAACTQVVRDRAVKLLVWYDNEWGYAARLVDFAALMAERGL